MKQFECGSLVPATWHTEADDAAEVVRRAAEHLRWRTARIRSGQT